MQTTTPTELEIVAPVEAQLVAYAGKSGLAETDAASLVEAFRPSIAATKLALDTYAGVAATVKDATCVSEIKQCREGRLALRRIRIDADKIRKARKEHAQVFVKTVDGFYNIIEGLITPVETALDEAEKTAERAELARKDALEAGRKVALAPFVANVALFPLRDMTEPAFVEMLGAMKATKEAADAKAKQAEADRLAKIEADRVEADRIKADNARLKKEADDLAAKVIADKAASDKILADQKAKADADAADAKAEQDRIQKIADDAAQKAKDDAAAAQKLADDKLAQERADAKAEQDRLKKISDDALAEQKRESDRLAKIEQDRVAAAEKTAKDLRDAETARLVAEKKKKDAEASAAKKAAAAPDREKLRELSERLLHLPLPTMTTDQGKIALTFVQDAIISASNVCTQRADNI